VIFPAEAAHVNPELVYWGTLLGCVEMLQNGVTTFCDGYFFEESAVRAVVEAGSRAVLGQGVLDFPTPDQPDPTHSRERAESFLAAFPHHAARLRPSLFCHAPYTCGAETLGWVKQLCRDQGILFQIHLSETASEVHALRARHGMSPVRYLEQLGILDEGTLCAHCVWVEPEEIAILARCRVGVAHDPESNMKLAAGVAPVPRLLAAGIAVGLGTDGCASNDDLDILAEMDRAAKLHKVFEGNPVVCSAPEVLRMGTCWGAAAIGWGDRIGSLEAGKNADLVAIDLDRPHLTPLYNPVSQLVYAARGSDVRHVWVAGRQVVTDGAVRTVDVADILREVNRIAERVRFS
jgi:5-methylthioadenosine/S-adenosylhomocysteine deaminase